MNDEPIDPLPSSPTGRLITADQRVAMFVFVLFILLLIIFPLLISMGKRNQEQRYEEYRSGTTQQKFD